MTVLTRAELDEMVEAGLAGRSITHEQAMRVLQAPDEMTYDLVAAAGRVRNGHFGRTMKLNYLVNLKSGMCPESCTYCSQSIGSSAEILRYTWLTPEEVSETVRAGVANGASTVCLVASGRGPSRREVNQIAGVIADIQTEFPQVHICACLGFIDDEKASTLLEAGATRYNHNLNTAESRYADVCTSHTYADRAETVETVRDAGMSACSGLIAGMGETDEELVEVAFALRGLGVDSVPVNFLLPFEGTPLESHLELTPQRCLRILSMMRFVLPDVEVRCAAGREYHLRSLQPLAFELCNSIFLGDYLTSEGQAGKADLAMLADGGFEIVGRSDAGEVCTGDNAEMAAVLAEHAAASVAATTSPEHVVDNAGIALRRRGAGTKVPANV